MFKKLLPYIVAVAVFAVVSIAYFFPYYQGQTLNQGDVTQWEGMSKEIVDWNKAHPDDPAMWTNRMFGGMPAVQISMNYPGNKVDAINHVLGAVFPGVTMFMFVMFVGFYILLLCFDVDPWLSLIGALAYGLSSFILISIDAGHNTKVQAMSLIAPVLGGMVLAYRKKILMGAAITAIFLALAIDANHLQIAYYILLMLIITGVYFLVTSVIEKRIAHFAKATAALVLAGVLGVLPNIANLWSTEEYGKETIRGGKSELTQKKEATKGDGLDAEYATRWSYGFLDGEVLSLMIPDIKGGGGGNSISEDNKAVQKYVSSGYPAEEVEPYVANLLYWGNQPFTSGPVYFGAAIVFVFIFGMFVIRSNIKWVLLVLTVFSLLLAFGHNTPFFLWMFNLLPFFNKFRNPSMAMVIAELTMPLTAILGLNEIFTGKISTAELWKKLKISGGIAAGIVIVFGVLGGFFYSFTGPNDAQVAKNGGDLLDLLKEERKSMLLSDSLRSLLFIVVAFGLIWAAIRQKLSKTFFVACIGLLFFIDGFTVARRYLNSSDFVPESKYADNHIPSEADNMILQDKDLDYRVYNLTTDRFNDAKTSYFHNSVGGYHAAKLIRYQDLIENELSKNNMQVLRMLNTKYVIVENPNSKDKAPIAQRFPEPLGNAWIVSNIEWVKNADQEMAALDTNTFDAGKTVVIDERYKPIVGSFQPSGDSGASVKLTSYTPNVLKYDFNAATAQLVVFSEIYYNEGKGWQAYLDGKPVEHFRANYVLRAMVVPAGNHKIEFKFEPKSLITGNKIAYAGSFFLFAFVLAIFGFAGYKRYKEMEAEPKPAAKAVTTAPAKKTAKKK